jgi:hypothetical protein
MKSLQPYFKTLLTAASVASLLYFPHGAISDSGILTVSSTVSTTTCTLLFSGIPTNNATLQLTSVTPEEIFARGGGIPEADLNAVGREVYETVERAHSEAARAEYIDLALMAFALAAVVYVFGYALGWIYRGFKKN